MLHPVLPLLLAIFALAANLQAAAAQTVQVAHLDEQASGMDAIREQFEQANPGYGLTWLPQASQLGATNATVALVQSGSGMCVHPGGKSAYALGDLFCLNSGESLQLEPPASLLVFTLPQPLASSPPAVIRPDWDEKITDQPGGCATAGDAYRRILLTWQGKNGPYRSRQINVHRVRIHDSFTHYHPLKGGFDEFYLVQEAPVGARLLLSEELDTLLAPKSVSKKQSAGLLREIHLRVGDLIYLPRGTVHRGMGGAVVQVITTPGFVPGAEISVDGEIEAINERLQLQGTDALPFHRGPNFVSVEAIPAGGVRVKIGGSPFTTLGNDLRHPDFWPLRNSAGHNLCRGYPRVEIEGERRDHPHHQGLWFAHGQVNGLDFWHDKNLSVVTEAGELVSGPSKGSWSTENTWLNARGDVLMMDKRMHTAFVSGDVRGLDFDISLRALEQPVVFGDTKEGSFALRVAQGLVADAGASLVDSEGRSGKKVWGKRARWIQARGKVNGQAAAVVLADHRNNPRAPTHWHARTYGLLAANPFGLSFFENQPKNSGDLTIAAGESIRFRYRVLLFARHPSDQEVESLLKDW